MISGFAKRHGAILFILAFSLIMRLAYFGYDLVWWDSAVYIGMGKFLMSFPSGVGFDTGTTATSTGPGIGASLLTSFAGGVGQGVGTTLGGG